MWSPSCATANARQVVARRPSSSTVHDPHWPWSQPFFGAVTPRCSRSRSRRVTRLSTRMLCGVPSTCRVMSLKWAASIGAAYPDADRRNAAKRPSTHDDRVLSEGDEFTDDDGAGNLAGDQQAAGGLSVGEQQRLLLVDGRQVGVRPDPVEVAARAAADVALPQCVAGAV